MLYYACNVGVGCSRRRCLALVCVPHYALHLECRVDVFYGLGYFVGVFHVYVLVAVVAHEHQEVLPAAGVVVAGVVYGLVNHDFGLGLRAHREAAYGHVELVCLGGIAALSVVETAEEAVVDVAVYLVERVFALVA